MRDVILLIDICCDVYDNPRYHPANGITYCNLAAEDICHAFGCHDFDLKNADEIFEFLKTSPNWEEKQIGDVQMLANSGSLVFAIASSQMLGQQHGHLCVIRPGHLKESGKWGQVPCVMNIGASNFIGRAKTGPLQGLPCGVNECFVPIPKFYVYVPSL